jgi:hypothetical protein
VIVHILLFRPKATLDAEGRVALADAFAGALEEMPSVRRAQVGKRVKTGRPYDALMSVDYSHAAIIEFDDRKSFQVYLDHPAHAGLAARFFQSFEVALFYDFEMGEDATRLL